MKLVVARSASLKMKCPGWFRKKKSIYLLFLCFLIIIIIYKQIIYKQMLLNIMLNHNYVYRKSKPEVMKSVFQRVSSRNPSVSVSVKA